MNPNDPQYDPDQISLDSLAEAGLSPDLISIDLDVNELREEIETQNAPTSRIFEYAAIAIGIVLLLMIMYAIYQNITRLNALDEKIDLQATQIADIEGAISATPTPSPTTTPTPNVLTLTKLELYSFNGNYILQTGQPDAIGVRFFDQNGNQMEGISETFQVNVNGESNGEVDLDGNRGKSPIFSLTPSRQFTYHAGNNAGRDVIELTLQRNPAVSGEITYDVAIRPPDKLLISPNNPEELIRPGAGQVQLNVQFQYADGQIAPVSESILLTPQSSNVPGPIQEFFLGLDSPIQIENGFGTVLAELKPDTLIFDALPITFEFGHESGPYPNLSVESPNIAIHPFVPVDSQRFPARCRINVESVQIYSIELVAGVYNVLDIPRDTIVACNFIDENSPAMINVELRIWLKNIPEDRLIQDDLGVWEIFTNQSVTFEGLYWNDTNNAINPTNIEGFPILPPSLAHGASDDPLTPYAVTLLADLGEWKLVSIDGFITKDALRN